MFTWLRQGGPMGILHTPVNVGVFPDCTDRRECGPDEILCNASTFRNYPGVEDQAVTEEEMAKHIEEDHVAAFNTFEQLSGFADGKSNLNKIALITKTRNWGYEGAGNPRRQAKLSNTDDGESRASYLTASIRCHLTTSLPACDRNLSGRSNQCICGGFIRCILANSLVG